ncbi:MAG: chemotaxis protein CheW [Candidatus Saganbacteria bacterium]|nr:chemotaxis protein CheW [Candidatus Saganbacteria bacterium]
MNTQAVMVEIQDKKAFFDVQYAYAVAKVDLPLVVVPHSEERILGVFNFRGKVLPIFNLNYALGLPTKLQYYYLLVLEKESSLVGVLSEKLPKIEEVEEEGLFPVGKIFS